LKRIRARCAIASAASRTPVEVVKNAVAALRAPARLFSRSEVLQRPSPAPAARGLYAWFFRQIPNGVPVENCVGHDGRTLLYVGIAPSRAGSAATLRRRLRQHYAGNASTSTLRLTLGSLLGIPLTRSGRTNRSTFSVDGEKQLSEWLERNAQVCWVEHPAPWEVEAKVIASLRPPLNLDDNTNHPFCTTLREIQRAAKKSARLSVAPEVLILSQRRAETYEPSGHEVCISITDPLKLPARLSDKFAAILRLSFTDITEPTGLDWDVLFNEDHAKETVAFIRQWPDVDRIVVHCRAGLSRSPGIATGLCELFAWGSADDLQNEHSFCNRFVRRELVRVGREMLEAVD